MTEYDKILGCLIGGAAGDAMGAATEIRTREQIHERFGGDVHEFLTPPKDTFGRGSEAGEITDDFSIAYLTAKAIAAHDGEISAEVAKEALIEWSGVERWFNRFAGPTTRGAILRMKGQAVPAADGFVPVNENLQSTNGGGMKIAPVALFSGGNVEKAIEDAITIASVTHPNNLALSGTCAVAAATAAALQQNATLFDVVRAGLYGAREGERRGRAFHVNAGASVEKRMRLAIYLGLMAEDLDHAIDDIRENVGAGLNANEAIPAVFGLMVAANGNTVDGIHAGVNIGDDTDTVATMVGGILGALNGAGSMPAGWQGYLEQQNGIDLGGLARSIQSIVDRK